MSRLFTAYSVKYLGRACHFLAASLAALWLCAPVSAQENSPEIVIGATKTAFLVWLAEEQGYFDDAGLNVRLELFEAGVLASRALIKGDVDLATGSDFAFVSNVLKTPDLRILSTLSASRTTKLFARRSSGITAAQHLYGKRVAVTRSGIGEYFLGHYLTIQGVPSGSVSLVDLAPHEIVDEIVAGNVDAAITWEPFVFEALTELGDDFVELPEQQAWFYYFLLIGRDAWLEENKSHLAVLLRALLRAEGFARDAPETAKRILAGKLEIDPFLMDHLWPRHSLRAALPQDLLLILEQATIWRMARGLEPMRDVPDFLKFLMISPLNEASPLAVTIIQ